MRNILKKEKRGVASWKTMNVTDDQIMKLSRKSVSPRDLYSGINSKPKSISSELDHK